MLLDRLEKDRFRALGSIIHGPHPTALAPRQRTMRFCPAVLLTPEKNVVVTLRVTIGPHAEREDYTAIRCAARPARNSSADKPWRSRRRSPCPLPQPSGRQNSAVRQSWPRPD